MRTFLADDGLYLDPDVPEGVRGPEALATEIERQLALYPGISIVSGAPDVLGDRAWFRWSATLGTEESFHGVDFVEFALDGRIARLTGFYEPQKEIAGRVRVLNDLPREVREVARLWSGPVFWNDP